MYAARIEKDAKVNKGELNISDILYNQEFYHTHRLFTMIMFYLHKICHESMYFMEIGILVFTLCFYLVLHTIASKYPSLDQTNIYLTVKGAELCKIDKFWPIIS